MKKLTELPYEYSSNHTVNFLFLILALLVPTPSEALTFDLPKHGNVIGHVTQATVEYGDSLSTIGRQYGIGGYEMVEANPGVSYADPTPGSTVTIPSQFILPSGPKKDIVINLAEMRLYFYHPDGNKVSTYPIGIGKDGWLTPLGNTSITRKRIHPTWVVPDSILRNRMAHGNPTPPVVPPGPENPLGDYAMNLSFKNIVIHGSPFREGIGIRKSHGCINMLNEDIAEIYPHVNVGTSVRIISEPVKIGMMNNKLYLEAHVPLQEALYNDGTPLRNKFQNLLKNTSYNSYKVRWSEVRMHEDEANGMPQLIGSLED